MSHLFMRGLAAKLRAGTKDSEIRMKLQYSSVRATG